MIVAEKLDAVVLGTTFEVASPGPASMAMAVATTAPARPSDAIDAEEFARAMADYKARTNRQFPTWSEVLEVLQGLGYRRRPGPSRQVKVETAKYRVVVRGGGESGRAIGQALARLGGRAEATGRGLSYAFATLVDRDRAIASVRSGHGWASVESRD